MSPDKWGYSTTKRYVHAVEKVLTVTSYQDTLSPEQYSTALAQQYDNMRAVKETKKPGEEDAVGDEGQDNMVGNAQEGGMAGEGGLMMSGEAGDNESTPSPPTDTPALDDESSAHGGLVLDDPSSTSQIDPSSAMDVDN